MKRTDLEMVNRATEVEQGQEAVARKSWQTPAVEELLVNQAENTLNFSGRDNGIYTS